MKNYFIKDNVCTPYKLILGRVNNYLKANGWQNVASAQEADICLIGCCGAFHSLEDEALGLIADAKKTGAEINVFGCLVRISPEKVSALSPHRVFTAPDWEQMESLVKHPVVPLNAVPDVNEFRLKEEYRLYDPGKQFILLQTGCSSNCPFCPHKMGIGGLKSIPSDYVLSQIEQLGKDVHTICLAGNDTGSYGTDIGTTYPELLKQILDRFDLPVHLSQVNADWLHVYQEELWPLLTNEKVREFQVLIQSTSGRLLTLMERKPVVAELIPYLRKLRAARKDLLLRTDLIIGYPMSTEEEDHASAEFVSGIFDEVAIHAFERFEHARIEKQGLPFYSSEIINARVDKIVTYLQQFQNVLVHRGGQFIKTLEAIEKPKDDLRKKYNCALVRTLPQKMRSEEKMAIVPNPDKPEP